MWEGGEDWVGLKTYFDQLLEDIVGWFGDNKEDFKRVGKDIGNAIKDGIADALTPDWLAQTLRDPKGVASVTLGTISGANADIALLESFQNGIPTDAEMSKLLNKAISGILFTLLRLLESRINYLLMVKSLVTAL